MSSNLGRITRFPQTRAHNPSKPLRAVPNPSAQSERAVSRFRRRKSDLTFSPDWGTAAVMIAGAVFWIVLAKWLS